MSVAAGLGIVLLLAVAGRLLPYGNQEDDVPLFVRPRGRILFIGFLCFSIFLAEGVVLDWGALFLAGRGMDPASAGFGPASHGRRTAHPVIRPEKGHAQQRSESIDRAVQAVAALTLSAHPRQAGGRSRVR